MKRLACLIMVALMALMPLTMDAKDIRAVSSEIRGSVLHIDGETPMSGLPVRLWNMETEETIHKTKTNKDGIFAVPRMSQGEYMLTVGRVNINMGIFAARRGETPQDHSFVIILPKRLPMAPLLIPTTLPLLALPRIMSP